MAKSDFMRELEFKRYLNADVTLVKVLPFAPDEAKDKLAAFMNTSGMWGYINEEGKIVIPPKYYSATSFKMTSHGLRAIVEEKSDGKGYRLIDENGDNITTLYSDMYFDGDFVVAKRVNKYGILGSNGKVAEPFIYDNIKNYIGKKVISSGKYKGYEAYYYFYNGIVNAKYGKPLNRCFNISTQLTDSNLSKEGIAMPALIYKGDNYFDSKNSYDKKVYVNIETNKTLRYDGITDFKEIEDSNHYVELRAIALDRTLPSYERVCLIDEYGHELLSAFSCYYTLEETNNNMYLFREKNKGIVRLYDMYGNLIIDDSMDIKVLDCGLILVQKRFKALYDEKGKLLREYIDYINVIGDKTDEYLVAEYMDDNNNLKSEIIDRNANAVIKKIDYDTTTGFVGEYAVLERSETDYTMNDPYNYKRHLIVDTKGNIIASFPKDNNLENFDYVENHADIGFFIAKYSNRSEYVVLDIYGNEIFKVKCDNLKFENDIFILLSNDERGFKHYRFYDKKGYDIFEQEYFDYTFLSNKSLVLYNEDGCAFVYYNEYPNISIANFRNRGKNIGDLTRGIGDDLSKRDKLLASHFTQENTLIKRYSLVDKNITKIKPQLDTWCLCTVDFDGERNRIILIDEIKENLRYFDLEGNHFHDIDIRGIDFTCTNAVINPQVVYKKSLDGCILSSKNLIDNYSLDGVSCENTIIDGKYVTKGYERRLKL